MKKRTISDRAAFYHRHRKQIEQWAALKEEADEAAEDFFQSLRAPLTRAALTLQGTPEVISHFGKLTNRFYAPHILLALPSWRRAGLDHPLAGVGIEWGRPATIDDSYSGIWLNQPEGAFTVPARAYLVESVRVALGEPGLNAQWPDYEVNLVEDPYWPAYRCEEAQHPNYLEDLDGYAQALVTGLCALWRSTASIVDVAVQRCHPKAR